MANVCQTRKFIVIEPHLIIIITMTVIIVVKANPSQNIVSPGSEIEVHGNCQCSNLVPPPLSTSSC